VVADPRELVDRGLYVFVITDTQGGTITSIPALLPVIKAAARKLQLRQAKKVNPLTITIKEVA
jgi:hypothetical protein